MTSSGTTSIHHLQPTRLPSIARRLAIGLIVTVALASTMAAVLLYYVTEKKEMVELNRKADEYLAYFTRSLELPVWNLDKPAVEIIGQAASQNELVVMLVISTYGANTNKNALFSYEDEDDGELIHRSGKILRRNNPIGEVELAVTTRLHHQNNMQRLQFLAITTIIIIVSIIVVSGFLIRSFLKNPLTLLNEIADRYGHGNYRQQDDVIPYQEFQRFSIILTEMGRKIEQQVLELKTAEEKYRSIFENALEGIFQSTPDGTIINANPAAAKILGYDTPEELMATVTNASEQLYVNPEDRQNLVQLLRENGAVNQFQVEMKVKDSPSIWAELTARAVTNKEGNFTLIEGRLTDITAQKKAAEERAELEKQLQQSQRIDALGKLTGGIAHDFNNLLQAMSGYVQLLLMQKDEQDTDHKYLSQIDKSMSRASELVKRLLTFSRKMEINYQSVSINEIVASTLQLMERTIPKMVALKAELAPDLPNIQADPLQIEQVLINLITNAVDAMEGSGDMIIETENFSVDREYKNKYLELTSGEYVLITVADTGIGMEEKTRQRVFEPFFTTKEQDKGTGLGLSTVYGIVKGHLGHIQCYSKLGVGTTFKIFLPVTHPGHDATDDSATPPTPVAELSGGNETILLVDDEEIILDTGEQLLTSFGYTVKKTHSGEEALACYTGAKDTIDLILIDLNMPGMGGEKCIEELLKLDPDAKIIVASGYTAHKICQSPQEYGAAGFISKPYRLDKLATLVRQTLDQK